MTVHPASRTTASHFRLCQLFSDVFRFVQIYVCPTNTGFPGDPAKLYTDSQSLPPVACRRSSGAVRAERFRRADSPMPAARMTPTRWATAQTHLRSYLGRPTPESLLEARPSSPAVSWPSPSLSSMRNDCAADSISVSETVPS